MTSYSDGKDPEIGNAIAYHQTASRWKERRRRIPILADSNNGGAGLVGRLGLYRPSSGRRTNHVKRPGPACMSPVAAPPHHGWGQILPDE
jgi:hypothetical protein